MSKDSREAAESAVGTALRMGAAERHSRYPQKNSQYTIDKIIPNMYNQNKPIQ